MYVNINQYKLDLPMYIRKMSKTSYMLWNNKASYYIKKY